MTILKLAVAAALALSGLTVAASSADAQRGRDRWERSDNRDYARGDRGRRGNWRNNRGRRDGWRGNRGRRDGWRGNRGRYAGWRGDRRRVIRYRACRTVWRYQRPYRVCRWRYR